MNKKIKLLNIFILIILLFLFNSCTEIIYNKNKIILLNPKYYKNRNIKKGILYKDFKINIQNIEFVLASNTFLTFYENGFISSGYLKNNKLINTKNTKILIGEQVRFTNDGYLFSSYIQEDTFVKISNNNIKIMKNSFIGFYKDLSIGFCSVNSNSNLFIGNYSVKFFSINNSILDISFDENGNIILLRLDGKGKLIETNNKIDFSEKDEFYFNNNELKIN